MCRCGLHVIGINRRSSLKATAVFEVNGRAFGPEAAVDGFDWQQTQKLKKIQSASVENNTTQGVLEYSGARR